MDYIPNKQKVKLEDWQKEGLDELYERIEIPYDTFIAQDFIEMTGNIGGDVVRYRYYKSGVIAEK